MNDSIPIQFIKEVIDKYYYFSGNSTKECEEYYLRMAKSIKSLLNEWEINGKRWVKEHGNSSN